MLGPSVFHRRLACELLEDRRLLSIGVDGNGHEILDVLDPQVVCDVCDQPAVAAGAAAGALPANTRGWETIPGVIRNNGVDTFRLEVNTNGAVGGVNVTACDPALVAPGTLPLALRDDGLDGDRVAGDNIFTSGLFRYNTAVAMPAHYNYGEASLSGVDVAYLVAKVTELDSTVTEFLVKPNVGILSSDIRATTITTLSSSVATSPHLVNVSTTNLETQRWLRGVGGGNLANLTSAVYAAAPDVFDFFMFFSTNKIEKTPMTASQNFTCGMHTSTRVNYTGTGMGTYNGDATYGSAGRLLGINVLDTYDRGMLSNNATHELVHQWSSFSSTSLGLSDNTGHYIYSTSVGSLVGGFQWIDNGDGTFTLNTDEGRNGGHEAPPLDKYMMGLIGPEDVPMLYAISSSEPLPADGTIITQDDIVTRVSIDDIIARHGVRTPTPATAQRDFNIGFVAESNGRMLNATEMTFYELFADYYTTVLPAEEPDPDVEFNWAPMTRYFGEGTTWTSSVDPANPLMDVLGNGQIVQDGDTTPIAADYTDFGSQNVVGGTQTRTFTIHNDGGATLSLTGLPYVVISGANASDFTVVVQPSASSLAPSESVTFQIMFDPSSDGLRTATVSIANNDTDRSPYDFVIQGTGFSDTTPPTVTARTPAPGAVLTASSITVDVTFSEAVQGVDATDLVLTGPASGGAVVGAPVNTGGNTWRFPVSNLSGGSLYLSLAPDAGDIEDGYGNDLPNVWWGYTINRPIYSNTLDASPGWTTTGQWAFGHPTGQGGTSHGNPDPANGYTGGNVYGVNLSGDYSTTAGGPYYLTTSAINCIGQTGVTLVFQRWLNSDSPTYVTATVDVSTNGTAWTNIYTSTGTVTDSSWNRVQYNIGAYADNQPTVYLRWGYQVKTGAWAFSGWNIDDITLTSTPATPGITVSPISSLVTTEAGGTASFTVKLDARPAADVVIGLASSDTTEGTPSPPSLTFTSSNWASPQTVTITGVDDAAIDDAVPYTILTAEAASADPAYNGINPLDVTVVNVDDDQPGITLTINSASISEGAGTGAATATVTRDTDTTDPLVVYVRSSDATEATVPASVTIPANQASVTFPIDAVNDAVADGTQTVTITGSASFGAGPLKPDVTFNGSGVVTTDLRWNISPKRFDLEVQSDGKILAIGRHPTADDAWNLVRLSVNGGYDSTFGANGVVSTVFSGESSVQVSGIIQHGDGRITVVGQALSSSKWLLARYNANGSLDTTFSGDGIAVIQAPVSSRVYDGVANVDGTLLLIGEAYNGQGMVLTRIKANGTLDTAFGTSGVVSPTMDPAGDERAYSIVRQSDGKLVVAGKVMYSGSSFYKSLVARFNADGSLDPSFSGDGYQLIDLGYRYQTVNSLALQPDDRIVLVGSGECDATGDDWQIIRLDANGELDLSFNGDGFDVVDFGNLDDQANDVVVQSDGKIVVVGSAFISGDGTNRGFVRYNSDGSRDVLFGDLGLQVLPNLPEVWEAEQAAVIQSDGRLVTYCGYSTNFRVERYLLPGVLTASDTLDVTDDELVGFVISPTGPLVTTEAGGTATFTIALMGQPTANVTFTLSSSDTSEGTVSPSSLTFTSSNWNTAQPVTITGVNDSVVDGNITYSIVTGTVSSSDANYNGLNPPDVTVVNNDNDVAGFTVSPTSGLVTTEAGGTATFTVRLTSQPTASVTIVLSSSDSTEGSVSPASLTFTTSSWSTAKTVTVTGVDDFAIDGSIAYSILTAAAASSDINYDGKDVPDVSVTNSDNDVAGFTVAPSSGLVTTEAGGTATFAVRLNCEPTADVIMVLSSSDASEGAVSPTSLTFTLSNWNTPQIVTVSGVDDSSADGSVEYTIVTSAAASSDLNYNGVNAVDVSVSNQDDDKQYGSLLGCCWKDSNGNGIREPGEPGVAGAVVELYLSNNSMTGDFDDVLQERGITDADGNYGFQGWWVGIYGYMVFRAPVGYSAFTVQHAVGGTDTNDSDVNSIGATSLFTISGDHTDTTHSAGMLGSAPAFGWACNMGGLVDNGWSWSTEDCGHSIAVAGDGTIYTKGQFHGTADFDPGPGTYSLTSPGSTSTYVARYSSTGALLWARRMGGFIRDYGNSLDLGEDGSVYMTGCFSGTVDFDPGAGAYNLTSAGSDDFFVSKWDSLGDFVWARSFGASGNDRAASLAVDDDGSVYATGSFSGTVDFDPGTGTCDLSSAGGFDVFVLRLDSAGGLVWARGMGGGLNDYGTTIAVAADGSVYTAGTFDGPSDFDPGTGVHLLNPPGYDNVFVSKLDEFGNYVWAQGIGADQYGASSLRVSIALAADGSVCITGNFYGLVDFDPGPGEYSMIGANWSYSSSEIYLLKLDSSGNFVWVRQLGGTSNDYSTAIAMDTDGSIYTTGYFTNTADFDPGVDTYNLVSAGTGYPDVCISKLNSSGDFVWARKLGGAQYDEAFGLALGLDGSIYTTGLFFATADFNPGMGEFNLTSSATANAFISKLMDDHAPTDIAISSDSVVEHQPIGTLVGSLTSMDSDPGESFSYALVPGSGSDDNADFTIDGSGQVLTAAVLHRETNPCYRIRVRTTDYSGMWYEEVITIAMVDAYGPGSSSAGDLVWNDLNGNGVQDPDDCGVAGAVVELYLSTNSTVGDADDMVVARAITDSNGNYTLGGLLAGVNYYEIFRAPVGFTFVSKDVGTDDAKDSEADSTGVTAMFTLSEGQNDTGHDAGLVGAVPGFGFALQAGANGNSNGGSVAVDGIGNVFVTGDFEGTADFDPGPGIYNLTSAGGSDIFVAKYSQAGALVWARRMGESSDDVGVGDSGHDIAVTADGNVYITGCFHGIVDFDPGTATANLRSSDWNDAFVLRLDTDGNFIWARRIGGWGHENGVAIAVAGDGSVYTTGYFSDAVDFDPGPATYNITPNGNDIFILRLDSAGNFNWAGSLGGADDSVADLAVGSDGRIYITGSFAGTEDFDLGAYALTLTSTGASDAFLLALDSANNLVFAKQMGGVNNDYGNGIAVGDEGSVAVIGTFYGTADFDPSTNVCDLTSTGSSDVFVSKLDSSGSLVWARGIGGTNSDAGYDVAVTNNGDVCIIGTYQGLSDFDPGADVFGLTGVGGTDVFVSELDSGGNFLSACSMGGPNWDYANDIAVARDGSIHASGRFYRSSADFDPGPGTFSLSCTTDKDLFVLKLLSKHAPTDISLSVDSVAENQPIGTVIGDLSSTDSDSGEVFSYSLVTGSGSTDNGSFTVDASGQLLTDGIFDHETQSLRSIRIRSTDYSGMWYERTFTISIVDVNEEPTGISLSNTSVPENRPSGTVVGAFETTDPDSNSTFSYTLVAGEGSEGNSSFTISGSTIQTSASFDYHAKNSYSIRVRSTDQGGLSIEEVFEITVLEDTAPPAVRNVLVRGSAWASAFPYHNGYPIPVSDGTQLATLPWVNIDQITVVFSENVALDKNDLLLSGVNTATYNVSGSTFSYDAVTFTATWTLPQGIGADKLLIHLNADGASPIVDAAANRLDGEWTNPTSVTQPSSSVYPSGNGTAGGDFLFRFNVLPGDANRDGYVKTSDALAILPNLNKAANDSGYTAFIDVDGNGQIKTTDTLAVLPKLNTSLPSGEPVAGLFPSGASLVLSRTRKIAQPSAPTVPVLSPGVVGLLLPTLAGAVATPDVPMQKPNEVRVASLQPGLPVGSPVAPSKAGLVAADNAVLWMVDRLAAKKPLECCLGSPLGERPAASTRTVTDSLLAGTRDWKT